MARELSLSETWSMLESNSDAILIDVRTTAEWATIGVPDLSTVEQDLRTVEWVMYPHGLPNENFMAEATLGLTPDQPILLLCRSGARSAAAAASLVKAGFTNTYNVVAGFEGHPGPTGQRQGGWKDSLPWTKNG